jgi:APA family basic amino acid/polyamine antiporter
VGEQVASVDRVKDQGAKARADERRLQTLSVVQAASMLVGIVVGIGIFKVPPIVAANVGSEAAFLAVWFAGGVLTLIGALCYAELSSTYPDAGGEYLYLNRAYGNGPAFLFAWGRMTVMQTGAIAAVAFVYGDYASTLIPLGALGPALHAVIAVIVLTAIQLVGTELSGRAQFLLTVFTVLAVAIVALCGFVAGPQPSAAQPVTGSGALGLAMVFILLTYGGWNETAYVSGEVENPQRNMVRVLVLGTAAVMALYLFVNAALIYMLGLSGLRQATAVMTQPIERIFGTTGAAAFAIGVCIAALSTLNATIFTGARSNLALGTDFSLFSALGKRNPGNSAPTNALLLQGAITLALIAFGSQARSGFQTMVEYTAPVFWTFMLLIGISLFLFRMREPNRPAAFRVPLYPVTPIIFCLTCLYLLYSSVMYTGAGALVGIAILVAGIPVYLAGRGRQV